MKKTNILYILGLAVVSLAALPARAQCPAGGQVLFLFDQSNSMNEPGHNGRPKWEIARDLALSQYSNLVKDEAQIAIAGFGNTTIGGTLYYNVFVDFSDNVRKNAANDTFIRTKLGSVVADVNDWTPLAGGLCDGVDKLYRANPSCTATTSRTLYLYSDGLENSTPTMHTCYSDKHSNTPFDASKAGTGFGLEAGSWERKVANMAYNANPNIDHADIPDSLRPVLNVSLLFDTVNGLSAHDDGERLGAIAQAAVDDNGVAFFKGIATVSFGSYFEAKKINGAPAKSPVPGDTNPLPTLSCVDQADVNRIIEVFARPVRRDDPQFSAAELAARDVNDDLVIDVNDLALALRNFGVCH
jgi:hypothetical protein